MKRLLLPACCALGLLALPAYATPKATPAAAPAVAPADAPPSDASLKELLELANAAKLIDSMMGQIDGMMKNMVGQASQGHTVTPQQQAAIDKFQAKAAALMREELTWAKLEPMYLRIYRESLTQGEVDGMIAFYKTPAGQAAIKKLPMIMQKTMAEMPVLMNSMMQKMQSLSKEFAADMQATAAAPATAPAAGQK